MSLTGCVLKGNSDDIVNIDHSVMPPLWHVPANRDEAHTGWGQLEVTAAINTKQSPNQSLHVIRVLARINKPLPVSIKGAQSIIQTR